MNILQGKRVMIVEDESLVALMIEDILLEQECEILGPYTNLADALTAAHGETMDVALLDVNLRGVKIYPVARALSDRGVPFLLLSGYGADAVPADEPSWRACAKPFTPEDLIRMLIEQLQTKAYG
jgi:DNA-binding response OmpR family regulator